MKKLLLLLTVIVTSLASYGFVAEVTNNANMGPGSLRQAINDANSGDTILINVSGIITLDSKIDIVGFDGLTIIGPYPAHLKIQPDGGMTGQLFDIQGSNNVAFHNIGFENGNSNINTRVAQLESNIGPIKFKNCLFEGMSTGADGGVFWSNNSELIVLNCSFFGNSGNRGGAINIESGMLKAINCTFSGNVALAEGGAILMNAVYDGSFLNHCTFRENSASNGQAVFLESDGSVIVLKANAVEGNGSGQQIVDAGGSAVTSEESNVIKDNGTESYPWMGGFDVFTVANLEFQLPHRTDGYGLKYYVPQDESSPVVDRPNLAGSVAEPIFDTRRAPRIITGNSSPLPDAGAVEYTPLRVTSSGGDDNIVGMLGWAILQSTDPVNYVEFDIPLGNLPATINPGQTSVVDGVNSTVIIDGFSQESSLIPGPEFTSNPGVIPGNLPVTVQDNQGLSFYLQVGVFAQNSRISGLRFLGFDDFAVDVSADSVKVQGCIFGIDQTNTSDPNINAGVRVSGSSNNIIGGKEHWQRNVFSGNGGGPDGCGLLINAGTFNCIVAGNLFGTADHGMSGITGPVTGGKGIVDRGNNSKIGTPGILTGNVISGNLDMGVFEDGSNECKIHNNKIGLLYDGMTSLSNNLGINVDNGANGLFIGGLLDEATRNYITANNDKNILIRNANTIQVLGNVIGLDQGGVGTPQTSPNGIVIDGTGAFNIQIGDAGNVNSRNYIAGNLKAIHVVNSGGAVGIYNNFIGTDMAGTNAISNQDIGIEIEGAANPVSIGIANAGNVISGFQNGTSIGIHLKVGATGHYVQGNIIGLDESGTAQIGNQKGIVVNAGPNYIGGDFGLGDGNVISGNVDVGIQLGTGADGCTIQGNLIGTNETGTAAITPNQLIGIQVTNSSNTLIGGTGTNEANLISGHSATGGRGIQLDGTATGTQVYGNRIGTNAAASAPIANEIGILILDQHTAQIGSGLFGNENFICANTAFGIDVHSTGNVIDGNIVGLGAGNADTGMGNGVGLRINSASNSVGPTSTSLNIFSNNTNEGILIIGDAADNNQIDNAHVGTDNANNPFGNGGNGIFINDGDVNAIGMNFPCFIGGNGANGIEIFSNANQNEITQSVIGDAFSTGATNGVHGIQISDNSMYNIVGSNTMALGNTIVGNTTYGVHISADSNIVMGNHIGVDGGGAVIPNAEGIFGGNCTGLVIGKDWAGNGEGNVVSGHTYQGIYFSNVTNSIIAGNIVGANPSGNASIPNKIGILLQNSNDNQIGGEIILDQGNLISGNGEYGLSVENSDGVEIYGNTIGLDAAGTVSLDNFWSGINLEGCTNAQIGQAANSNRRNLISGNEESGLLINGGSGHVIAQNLIGTDAGGINGIGVQDTGISVVNATSISIGGNYLQDRNVIVGNVEVGVSIHNSTSVDVHGNTIGNLTNYIQESGVSISGGSNNNFIGQPNPAAFGNEFVQNMLAGVKILDGSFNNKVRSNFIGYFRDNTLPDSLQEVGVLIEPTSGTANRIGEDIADAGNFIGYNNSGIIIDGINDQTVYNNLIGLDTSGTIAYSNAFEGIVLENGAATNQIGNTGAFQSNVISGNGNGILITGSGTSANYIYGNNIGMNLAQSADVANGVGFVIEAGASGNHIGADNNTGNAISGNYIGGIISGAGTTLNNVKSNLIGVQFPNTYGLVIDDNADANHIGGSANERNIISANDSVGLGLINCNGNFIESNFIGLAPNGIDNMGNLIGIYGENSDGNFIGGQGAEKGNVISGNALYGIALDQGSDNNQIKNNFIGTDSTGNAATAATANEEGILIFASTGNIIGGDWNIDEGNVVAGNTSYGIHLDSSSTNQIIGNNIGLSKDNDTYLGNGDDGIFIDHESNGNTIGTTTNGEENVITANSNAGIRVKNSNGNFISGNFIGNDDIGGTGTVGNGSNGQLNGIVFDTLAVSNVAHELNIISGHVQAGVYFNGPGCEFNQVEGNYIGVDATGNSAYSNGNVNVYFNNGASNNILGGSNPNVIGGDSQYQIQLFGANTGYNQIINNNINIGLDGTTTFNSDRGVFSTNFAHSNKIGSGISGEGNYFGGFNEHAIHLERADTSEVFGNSIGVNPNGNPSSNVGAGIFLEGSDQCNIGGVLVGSDSSNVIANNDAGIVVTNYILNSSYGNELFGNAIYNNINQGIDINNDGAELPNDTSNFSVWNNGEIDHPLILTAWNCGGGNTTHVGFEFYSANIIPGYRVEFYSNTAPDGNGFPEGETYLGQWTFNPATTVDTIDIDLGVTLSPGTILTATITGVSGNTSEFSQEFAVETVPTFPVPTVIDETCFGAANGVIEAPATGAHYFSTDGITYEYSKDGDTLTLPNGTYTIYAQYLNGCVLTQNATLNPGPALPFSYTVVDDTCGLGFGSITIDTTSTNGGGGSNNYAYTFNNGSAYLTSIDTMSVNAGTYNVGLVDVSLGCYSNIDAVVVNDITDVVDESFSFDDFCPNQSALPYDIAEAGGTFAFNPPPGDGAVINGTTGEITSAITGNSYTVEYTVGICNESSTQTVVAAPVDDSTFTYTDFCIGTQPTISTTTPGGTWSLLTGTATIDAVTGVLDAAPGNYNVQYTTNGTCPSSNSDLISVYAQPAAPEIIATDSVFCEGESTTDFAVVNPFALFSYDWYLNTDLGTPDFTGDLYNPGTLPAGGAWIYLNYVDTIGCNSLFDSIEVVFADNSGMYAMDDQEVCLGSQLTLEAFGGETYMWSASTQILGDLDESSTVSNITLAENFIVEITDTNGCLVIDTVVVTLADPSVCNVDTYTAFSPDGDGTNDYWLIDGIEGFPENTVFIYNRWGDVLQKFVNYDNQNVVWDGTNKGGDLLPSGTYFYVVEVGGSQNQAGWIQIVK